MAIRRLTADKREIKDFPKLLSATSFIRNTLSAMWLEILFISEDLVYGR